MLYLKLSRNQEQEWSSVTVSSLAKKLVGVNNIVIENVELEATSVGEQIVIRARPRKNAQCRCGVCGRKCSRFDHGKGLRRWRAPDLGAGTMIFIEAEAPRVNCPEHGVVVQQVPWARHKSRFTRSFEDTAVWLSLHLSRKAIAEYLQISWDTVGPMITRVEQELSAGRSRFDGLVNIAIDETSYKKGHKYLTLILNHDTNAVVWAGKGYGKAVLEQFFMLLTPEQRQRIHLVSGDGAQWIKNTVYAYCPNATFCIDPFHVVSWCTELLDAVRKEEWNKARMELAAERKGQPKRRCGRQKCGQTEKTAAEQRVETVKSAKYPLLMNPDNLNERYKTKLQQILLRNRRLATAYRLKEELRLIFKLPVEEVGAAIEKWRRRAWSCRIPQFVELQRKIKRHKNAILATIRYGISNARMEATNNKVKLTLRMAYGFRNIDHLISAIFLRCGNLPIYLPGRHPLPATHTL